MLAFSHRKNALLGLDISSTAVKLVELSRISGSAPSGIQVAAYTIEPLPPNTVVEQKITRIGAVGEAIGKVVTHCGTKVKRAATAVSGSAVITKVITLPASLSDEEIEAQIQLESDRYRGAQESEEA